MTSLPPSSLTPSSTASAPELAESRRRWWLVVALAAAAVLGFSLVVTAQTLVSMMDHGHSWWRIFGWHLGSWAIWIPAAPFVVRLGEGARWSEGSRWRTLRLWGPALLLAAGQLSASALAATVFQPYHPIDRISLSRYLANEGLLGITVDLIVFWSLVAIGSATAANRRSRAHQLRESRLEAELARAQLDALRLEIQPHFLFNTLNSVAALVRRRSNDRALEVVLGLSELLRSTLDRSDRHLVPLREEIDFVERYVALQKTRFGERLQVGFEVPEELLDLPFPWLALQPLVENAIRHGVATRARGGVVEIRARLEPTGNGKSPLLAVEVCDDGPGPGTEAPDGIGLTNVRSRLRQLYGDAGVLDLARHGDRTVATLRVPVPDSDRGRDETLAKVG